MEEESDKGPLEILSKRKGGDKKHMEEDCDEGPIEVCSKGEGGDQKAHGRGL